MAGELNDMVDFGFKRGNSGLRLASYNEALNQANSALGTYRMMCCITRENFLIRLRK